MVHKLICPLYIDIPRKTTDDKRYYINIGIYRNAHYHVNAAAKRLYKAAMREQLEGLKIKTPVEIGYKVFKPTQRRLDKMNVAAATSKFLLDAITEYGCWPDDNDDYVKTETIYPTEYDKNNGRVEVTIREI